MAINIQKKFSIDLGTVVENSITAVKAVRKSEQARKEGEFQRAIANGLSYEEQLSLRKKQLDEEKKSSLSDPDYILTLEKSISDTNKLYRFNKYRTKYADTFGELSAGKINEQSYLNTLKGQLGGIDDPELRLEVQQDIAAAEKGLKTYNDTILANKVKLAKYDGTVKTLASMVAAVTIARTTALLSDNQDEVTAHDETLAALSSQLTSVRIQDSFTDFQTKSATKGTNSLEKLEFMNSQIRDADPNTPVRIDEGNGNVKTYASAQQFWSLSRDNYLSSTFFKELESDVKNNVEVNSKLGMTQAVLDNTMKTYDDLRSKPEMAPFLNQLELQRVGVMDKAVDSFAKKAMDSAEVSLEFEFADAQLKAAGQKYGVDTSAYRSQLFRTVRGLEQGQLIPSGSTERLATKLEVDIPEIKAELGVVPAKPTTPVAPTTPTRAPITPTVPEAPVEEKVPATPTQVIETPQFTPASGVGAKSDDGKFTFTKEGWKQTELAPVEIPTATPVPVTPTTPSTYTGTSVVDYLKSQKQDASFESRTKLATEKGIADYQGTAKQNEELLKLLRG